MDSRYLTKDFIGEFIDVYREHPALWKIKSKQYLNKNLKHTGTLALIDVCKRYNVNADKDFVTKKIQSIRGSFRKELKKVNDSRRSGSATEDVYVRTLWYYDLLSFTTDQETMSKSIDNMNSPENSDNDWETNSQHVQSESQHDRVPEEIEGAEERQDSQSQETRGTQDIQETRTDETESVRRIPHTTRNGPKRSVGKKRSHGEETTSDFMKACTAALSTPQPSLGEFEAVGNNVALKLSKMNSVQQVHAEFLIQKVLKLGALQRLNDQMDVAEKTIPSTMPCHDNFNAVFNSEPSHYPSSSNPSVSSALGSASSALLQYENL